MTAKLNKITFKTSAVQNAKLAYSIFLWNEVVQYELTVLLQHDEK